MTKEPEHIRLPNAKNHCSDKARMKSVLKKWETIVKILEAGNMPENTGFKSCAFCLAYNYADEDTGHDYCDDCPIRNETEQEGCSETPFDFFIYAQLYKSIPPMLEAAKAELQFLIQLAEKRGWL